MIGIGLSGRLGNQMFQYAVMRSIAEKNGYEFRFDSKHWLGQTLFNVDTGSKRQGIFRYEYRDNDHYNPEIWNIRDDTLLVGYFQGEKYFDHDKVRRWYKPKIEVTDDYPSVCYIHFRG